MFLEDSWINCTIADDLHNCRLFARLQIFCTIADYLQDCWLLVQMHICGAPMMEIHLQTIKLLIFNAKSRISLVFLVVVKLVLTIIGPSCPHIEFKGFHWFQCCMSVATTLPKLETCWWDYNYDNEVMSLNTSGHHEWTTLHQSADICPRHSCWFWKFWQFSKKRFIIAN